MATLRKNDKEFLLSRLQREGVVQRSTIREWNAYAPALRMEFPSAADTWEVESPPLEISTTTPTFRLQLNQYLADAEQAADLTELLTLTKADITAVNAAKPSRAKAKAEPEAENNSAYWTPKA